MAVQAIIGAIQMIEVVARSKGDDGGTNNHWSNPNDQRVANVVYRKQTTA
jgi:hypothetical protein